MRIARFVVLVALAFAPMARAGGGPASDDSSLTVAPVVTSGFSGPTSLAFIGADDFLLLEKDTGKVWRVTGGVRNPTAVLDLAVEAFEERGLLGIALHPDFASNHFVYLYYNPSGTAGDTQTGTSFAYDNVVDRFTWDGAAQSGAGSLTFDSNVLTVHSDVSYHNGGAIAFGPDDKLYGVIGDGGHNDFATNGRLQNNATGDPDDTGIVFRLDDDGSAPGNNPFSGVMQKGKVFAYGIRNSFGLAFDPESGDLWESENGEDDYDELNRITGGHNGGWAKLMGPASRDAQGTSDLFAFSGSHYGDPVFSWKDVVAPTGIAFGGSALGASEGKLFVGDFNNGNLYRFTLNGGRNGLTLSGNLADGVADSASERDSVLVAHGFVGISHLETGPDGKLYVVDFLGNAVYVVNGTGGGGGGTHDLAFTSLKPPKKLTFAPNPPAAKALKLSLQNVGTATETIQNQGELDDLIDVTFTRLGSMSCVEPDVTLLPPKSGFPVTWEAGKKLSIGLELTWNNCQNDPAATTKTENHDDFTLGASLDLDALGETDADPSNDDCPRAPAGSDKGCGKTSDPFRIDLILK